MNDRRTVFFTLILILVNLLLAVDIAQSFSDIQTSRILKPFNSDEWKADDRIGDERSRMVFDLPNLFLGSEVGNVLAYLGKPSSYDRTKKGGYRYIEYLLGRPGFGASVRLYFHDNEVSRMTINEGSDFYY